MQEVTSLALILNKAYLELQVLFELSNDAKLYPQLVEDTQISVTVYMYMGAISSCRRIQTSLNEF